MAPTEPKRPVVIAHRGGAPNEIENSAAAFRHALAVGADALECDVRATADGVLVLLHDAVVRLGDDRQLVVRDTLYDVLARSLPWLVTLEDVLDEFGGHALLNLDLKVTGYEQAIARLVKARGIAERVYVTSQRSLSLRALRTLLPDALLGLSRGHAMTRWPRRWRGASLARWVLVFQALFGLRVAGAHAVAVHSGLVTPATVRLLQHCGYVVTAWTVDDAVEAERLVRAGVVALATNEPDDLFATLGWSAVSGYANCSGWREALELATPSGGGSAG